MPQLWDSVRLLVAEQLSRFEVKSAERRLYESEVHVAIERVVDQANPRLRALPGYRRKLFDAVARSLDYCGDLASRIPGPVRLDRASWSSDPLVNALFGSAERMRWAMTTPAVRAYLKETALETADCYGLLLAMPQVRSQLGIDLRGDTLQRDVKQTVVSFVDHELVLPAADPEAVRLGAKHGILDTLVGVAGKDIAEQESRIAEIEERLRILRIKQKALNPGGRGIDFLGTDSATRVEEYDAAGRRIRELEQDLADARQGLATLDDYLERLRALLLHPERHLGASLERVRLDRMNIVRLVGDDDPEDGEELEFLRGHRGDQAGRILLLVRFPRSEPLSEQERLKEVERYVNT
jgi:hypothetical protein